MTDLEEELNDLLEKWEESQRFYSEFCCDAKNPFGYLCRYGGMLRAYRMGVSTLGTILEKGDCEKRASSFRNDLVALSRFDASLTKPSGSPLRKDEIESMLGYCDGCRYMLADLNGALGINEGEEK